MKFKDSVGSEPRRFIAALEIRFKDRPNVVRWTEGYLYPIFSPTNKLREKYQKDFIGVHRLDHIEEIIVKEVCPC